MEPTDVVYTSATAPSKCAGGRALVPRVLALTTALLLVSSCGVQVVGDFPAGVIVEGRRYVAMEAVWYEFDPAELTPYREAEEVTVGEVDGRTVYAIPDVDPGQVVVMPRRSGLDPAYYLLVRADAIQGRTPDNDFGVPELCRYRIDRQPSCP